MNPQLYGQMAKGYITHEEACEEALRVLGVCTNYCVYQDGSGGHYVVSREQTHTTKRMEAEPKMGACPKCGHTYPNEEIA